MALPPLSQLDGEILDAVWYVHLRHARNDLEVLASVREFVDSLSPREISRLPLLCTDITRVEEISRTAVRLSSDYERLPPGSEDQKVYMRTISLLCYATDRLSQVVPAARNPLPAR